MDEEPLMDEEPPQKGHPIFAAFFDRMSRTAEGVLPAGAVVTIEPGIYEPGWGGVRIEDDVHLDAHGAELLTHFTHELLELA